MIGRGVSESRRGLALGLAFGAGPILAVIASVGSQLLLAGKMQGVELPFALPQVGYPWNFALLYGLSVPILAIAALQSSLYVVALPEQEPERQPFLKGVFGGFGAFLAYRLTLLASITYILVYSGHMVFPNISLYTKEAIGVPAEEYAGLQLTLRFGFKIVAGFLLGWLLILTNPRTLMVTTATLTVCAVLWALVIPGPWFLVSFGILGAGELFGVYYPNYILGCSPPAQMRRNMAFASLITLPVGFAPVLYGTIADSIGGKPGFQASFAVSLAILAIAILLVWLYLPPRPVPENTA
jgi:hypothetical protein